MRVAPGCSRPRTGALAWRAVSADGRLDGGGDHEIIDVPERTYDVTASKDGYESETPFEIDGLEDVRNVTIHTHPVLTYGRHRDAIRAWRQVAGVELEDVIGNVMHYSKPEA